MYALRTDEDVQQHDVYHDLLFGDGERRFPSDYRATNLAGYGELEWRLAVATVLAVGRARRTAPADYQDTGCRGFFAR